MPTALLALLLLAATVDPRLDEPLRLLAELHDAAGEPIGAEYAQLPDAIDLVLVVAPMPTGAGGHYDPGTRTLRIAEALLDEDPRVVAAGLVHELRHALDFDQVELGLLGRDCVELEARAFEAQASVTRAFWPDELPSGTAWERGLAVTVLIYERDGLDGLRAKMREDAGYRALCGE